MTSKKLGKKNTAKRKIQIREHFMNQMQTKKYFSDPLYVPDKPKNQEEEDDSSELDIFEDIPEHKNIRLQKEKNDSEEDVSDDILSANINLDDADKFVTSLGLNKKRKVIPKKAVFIPRITPKETASFKEQAEHLKHIQEIETQGNEEEEDENLI